MESATKKRWFSFSLKTLLVLMMAIAIGLVLYVKISRSRRAAIASIGRLHGSISYKESGPNWLRKVIPDEKFFWSPVAIRFDPSNPITDADLQSVINRLWKFDDLTYLNFDRSKITDAGIAQLVPFANKLESLDIRGTGVSDDGITYLQRFPRLTLLRLKGSAISPDGIEKIRKSMPNCKLDD